MASKLASKVGQGIGRIGDHQHQSLRRHGNDFGNNVSVDAGIGVEKLQPSGGVAAVRGTTGLFVDARGDDHEHGVGKVRIVAGAKLHCRRERRAVLEVCYDALRALLILIQHNDLARSSPHDEREKTSGAYAASANDADFHEGRSSDCDWGEYRAYASEVARRM